MPRPNWERDLNHAQSCLSDAKRAIENLTESSDGEIPVENTIEDAARSLNGCLALLREADGKLRRARNVS